jgi:hypothetical protein
MIIEAAKQALEALELVTYLTNHDDEIYEAITALRTAIAAQQELVLAEREACAKVCEDFYQGLPPKLTVRGYLEDMAKAIRARGQDPMPLFDDWPGGWGKP